ncbi:MAG: hypothetical protein C4533_04755 [Candidatus Omnitrophota bacterium]|nr:MAG: hypothetical protein C4533_04755 [Candidatus Omnitrophota bacterium]
MKECPNQKQNLANCNCSYASCLRKGLCCECVLYHRTSGQIPACFFPSDIEKTYDRSISNFLKINKKS